MNNMYRVTMVDRECSPWELLANSPDHAVSIIRKFYPETNDANLVATELTLLGDPINLLNQLHWGDKFAEIIHLNGGRPAMKGQTYVKGDFDPSRNEYQCRTTDGKVKYFKPYTKIIRLEV